MGTAQTFLTGEAVHTGAPEQLGVGWRRYWSRGGGESGVEQPGGRRKNAEERRASRVEARQREPLKFRRLERFGGAGAKKNLLPAAPPRYFPPCPREGRRRRTAAYGAHGRRRESAARMEATWSRAGWRRTRRRAGAGRPAAGGRGGEREPSNRRRARRWTGHGRDRCEKPGGS